MSQIADFSIQTHLLGYWVRERQEFTLEEAVRMLTLAPSSSWGFHDRGLLREGYRADVTIFDPETVIDKATFERPHQYPEGISCVIVNGEIVLGTDGKLTGKHPGEPIYGPGHSAP